VESNSLIQSDLTLSDLFKPDIFLNAYKQFCGMNQNIPVDELELECMFEKEEVKSKIPTLRIRGLLLQGCSYVNKALDTKEGNSNVEYEVLPVCYLRFAKKKEGLTDSDNLLSLPLFTNLLREKQIIELKMAVNGSKSDAIIRSVALAINP
jgi:hypothetical protein